MERTGGTYTERRLKQAETEKLVKAWAEGSNSVRVVDPYFLHRRFLRTCLKGFLWLCILFLMGLLVLYFGAFEVGVWEVWESLSSKTTELGPDTAFVADPAYYVGLPSPVIMQALQT